MKGKFLKFVGLLLCVVTMSISFASCGIEDSLNEFASWLDISAPFESDYKPPKDSSDKDTSSEDDSSVDENAGYYESYISGNINVLSAKRFIKNGMIFSPYRASVYKGATVEFEVVTLDGQSVDFSIRPVGEVASNVTINGHSVTFVESCLAYLEIQVLGDSTFYLAEIDVMGLIL